MCGLISLKMAKLVKGYIKRLIILIRVASSSREMMIIFVYDTQLLRREEDDPASAILYFHPGWVSDQQRTSLCGQIIGTTNFLQSVFGAPRIFALQSGKFSIRTYGRYILVITTICVVRTWLKHLFVGRGHRSQYC